MWDVWKEIYHGINVVFILASLLFFTFIFSCAFYLISLESNAYKLKLDKNLNTKIPSKTQIKQTLHSDREKI